MEYATKFIPNLEWESDTNDKETLVINIHKYEPGKESGTVIDLSYTIKPRIFGWLIYKQKIIPGVYATYNGFNYGILDRNLRENIGYKSDVMVSVNANKYYSFDRIRYFDTADSDGKYKSISNFTKPDGKKELKKFPVVSTVSNDGAIYDVFKLPWNIRATNGKELSKYFLPSERDDHYNVSINGSNGLRDIRYCNETLYGKTTDSSAGSVKPTFLMLGLYTEKPSMDDILYDTVLTIWEKWIEILRKTYNSSDNKITYIADKISKFSSKCNTLKQFVELIITKWNADTSTADKKIIDFRTDIFAEAGILYFSKSEMNVIKNLKNYISSNLVVAGGTDKLDKKHYLKYDGKNHSIGLYYKSEKHNKVYGIYFNILGVFDIECIPYIFNGEVSGKPGETQTEKVYISCCGNFAQKPINGFNNIDENILVDLMSLPAMKEKTPTNNTSVDLEKDYVYSLYITITDDRYNEYDVGIIAPTIKYNVISTVKNNKLYTYKKMAYGDNVPMAIFQLSRVSNIGKVDSDINKLLDNFIETEVYISPKDYYSNFATIGEYSSGDTGFVRVKSEYGDDDDIPKWFWSDTLKNWCIYKETQIRNTIKLYVWNGKNNWDDFEDVLKNPMYPKYLYDVSHLKFGIDFSTSYKYQNLAIIYKSVILTYDNDFSQYTRDTYQTLRIGKMWSKDLDKNTNRYPFSIGLPPVMRLASGEIALMYRLTLPGVDKDHPLIYPEHIKFINDVCRNYFGAGDDRTIEDDWKRVEKLKAKPDTPSVIQSMAESSVVDADEINTVEDSTEATKLLFVPFKQYIETDNISTEGYVERWS